MLDFLGTIILPVTSHQTHILLSSMTQVIGTKMDDQQSDIAGMLNIIYYTYQYKTIFHNIVWYHLDGFFVNVEEIFM